ncbi:hypothetical protein TPHA_0P00680 [Tetrapisispora phaffii CBS 4417]|uniref:ubiquitinyl hydrolase 1 n=1 Tax=Tetrapisispora phaffii (strain ATCC 24235 / CBS 4417 / NBRC 1672 / NRRL Y-8282 / UCD 70-5) TaxID=1071381 RepID=G8C248_TETPH|nr:hypothetical protein TPHA_0P00680 [Tetrapisispora phaffii CBS 4417]CCE66226.1 hypothetical protein TPHA_0P00680 [Tetrapisispora phaffii CBS 4417]
MLKRLLRRTHGPEETESRSEECSNDSRSIFNDSPSEYDLVSGVEDGDEMDKCNDTPRIIPSLIDCDLVLNAQEPVPVEVDPESAVEGVRREIEGILSNYDVGERVFGFQNFGYTCYCNSILQALFNIGSFRDGIIGPASIGEFQLKNISMRKNTELDTNANIPANENAKINATAATEEEVEEDGKNLHHNKVGPLSDNYTYKLSPSTTLQSMETNESGDETEPLNASIQEQNGIINDNTATKKNNNDKVIILGRQINEINDTLFEVKVKPVLEVSCSQTVVKESSSYLQKIFKLNREDKKYKKVENKVTVMSKSSISPTISDLKNDAISDTNEQNETKDSPPNNSLPSFQNNIVKSLEERKQIALRTGPVQVLQSDKNNTNHTLFSCLRDIFIELSCSKSLTGLVSPTGFIDILKRDNVLFNTYCHQDAHEFFNFLINDLCDYLDNSSLANEEIVGNIVSETFKGIIKYQTRCSMCDSITEREEQFLDFPIEFNGSEKVEIQELLGNYCAREILRASNKFYCEICNEYQEAERLIGIKELPKHLVVHLKRFKYCEEKNCNIKLFNKVNYPFTLNISSVFDDSISKKYELNSIVVHIGESPQLGHYVTLCKHKSYGWLIYDDETVQAVSDELVSRILNNEQRSATAYLLFYEEVDSKITQIYDIDLYAKNIEALLRDDELLRKNTAGLIVIFKGRCIEKLHKPYPKLLKLIPNQYLASQRENNLRNKR